MKKRGRKEINQIQNAVIADYRAKVLTKEEITKKHNIGFNTLYKLVNEDKDSMNEMIIILLANLDLNVLQECQLAKLAADNDFMGFTPEFENEIQSLIKRVNQTKELKELKCK
jgi:hypothetical protein